MDKRLARPDLRISSSKWSAAKTSSSFFARVALVTTIGAILGGMSLVFLYPYLNIDEYRKAQKINRIGIDPEQTQPAGLPIWRDPFDRKKS